MQKDTTVNMALNMRLPINVSKFISEGTVGDGQNHFTKEQKQYVDNPSVTPITANGFNPPLAVHLTSFWTSVRKRSTGLTEKCIVHVKQ